MMLGFRLGYPTAIADRQRVQPDYRILLSSSNNPAIATAQGRGELAIELPVSSPYAGGYRLSRLQLSSGPACLVPPQLAISTDGTTLQVTPGLWASNPEDGPAIIGGQWMRDDVPVPQDGLVRPLEQADHGCLLRYVEMVRQGSAETFSTTAAFSVPLVPITVSPPAKGRVYQGQLRAVDVSAFFDSLYQPLSYAVSLSTPLPSGVRLTSSGLLFAQGHDLPAGDLSIGILATDGRGQTAQADFDFEIMIQPDEILLYRSDGTVELHMNGDVITLTFTGGAYTGEVFTFSAGAVAAGPHFPAASVINGTGTIGQPMTLLRKGFHISDAEAVPVALVEGWAVVTGADSFEWVGSGDPTYTPSSGGRYAWVQQASDGNGTVVNLSNVIEVTIPGTAPDVFASRPNGTLLSAGGFGSGLMWESSPNRGEVRDGILCPTGASGNMTLQRRLQTVSADQFAEAVIKLPAAAGWSTQEGTGIAVRINLDNGRGIFAFYSPTNSGGVAGGWHRVSVYGEGGIGHPVNISAPFEADREYTYRLEAEGSIFRFYVDDALIGTADARNSAGDIGIYARGQTAGTRTRPGVKQFDGGNL